MFSIWWKTISTLKLQTKLLSSHVTPGPIWVFLEMLQIQPSMARSTGFWDTSWATSVAERALQNSLHLSPCWYGQKQSHYCWNSTTLKKKMSFGNIQAPSLLPHSFSFLRSRSCQWSLAQLPCLCVGSRIKILPSRSSHFLGSGERITMILCF